MFITRLLILGVLLGTTMLISACGLQEITYDKRVQNVNDVEEMLEARLEMENPNKDIDVSITFNND